MRRFIYVLFSIIMFSGCTSSVISEDEFAKLNEGIENEKSQTPTIEELLLPESLGERVGGDSLIEVDYSNSELGYIQAKTLSEEHNRIKFRVEKDEVYTYDINYDLEYETFPLNMGDGVYTISAYENIEGDRYSPLFSFEIDVVLENETLPFLFPSQLSDYDAQTKAVLESFELTKDLDTELERVKAIYDYVVTNYEYDFEKQQAVRGEYVLPVLDETYDLKTGICFDYASITTAMLRAIHIPTRLVTGYVEEGYHAWVEVYIENIGWINPKIYFENKTWTSFDPTFDSMDSDYDGAYDVKYRY